MKISGDGVTEDISTIRKKTNTLHQDNRKEAIMPSQELA
jgi:hypothetical protein